MGGTCSTNGRDESAYNVLVGKPEGKRPLGRLGADGMNLREMWWGGVNCVHQTQSRDQWRAVLNTTVTTSFSRRTLLHVVSSV